MKSLRICFAGLVTLSLLAGCAGAIAEPTSTPQDTETAIPAATAVIGTPTLTITPIPPPTRRPTSVASPSLTPATTIPPVASFTRVPTSNFSKTPSPTITGTNTLFVRPVFFYRTVTATPVPFRCSIVWTTPEWGKYLRPRTDFIAKWKILNTGASMWHVDDVFFGFVGGQKMHNPDRVEATLPLTVYAGSSINMQVHMRPPKEPGIYTAIWGLRKSNKQDFFCTFEVTVEVVK